MWIYFVDVSYYHLLNFYLYFSPENEIVNAKLLFLIFERKA